MSRFYFTCLALLFCASALFAGEPNDAVRRGEYESIQKELEAVRPAADAQKEEVLTFVEVAKEKLGGFSQKYMKTPEGFEAASMLASMLSQLRHPEALKHAEMAADSAPKAGVDVKRVALCWALVTDGRMQKGDTDGAKAALAKVKEFDAGLFEQLNTQIAKIEEQMRLQKEIADRLQVGKEAVPITGTDMEGTNFSTKDWRGKVVLIDFWATWCGPCMAEVPALIKMYGANKEKGFEILGVSLDRNEAQLKNVLEKRGMKWPILWDKQGALANQWQVQSIPSTYLLDKKGVIRHINLRGEELSDAVKKLLDE